MKTEIKNYVKYFLKSNQRLLLLETLILFVFMPFATFVSGGNSIIFERQELTGVASIIGFITLFCSLILAFFMPLYIFRFIYKRQSSDMYFALPIKRGQLFSLHYVLGLILALAPLCVNYLLEIILLSGFNRMGLLPLLKFYFMIIVLFLVVYTIVTFISIKCNNLLDAFIVAGAYMILPLIITTTFMSFIGQQGSELLVSNNNITLEFMDPTIYTGLISAPFIMALTLINFVAESEIEFMQSNSMLYIFFVYWIVIGILCYYLARKNFIARKEEDAQQRTKALCTYPVIINVITVCMILVTFSMNLWSTSMITSAVIIFMIYILMRMFAKRTLHLKIKDMLFFVVIFALTFGFSTVFQSTNGFGLIYEAPQVYNIKSISIYLNGSEENQVIKTKKKSLDLDEMHEIKLVNKKDINTFMDVKDEIIEEVQGNNLSYNDSEQFVHIQIDYNLTNGKEVHRYYNGLDTHSEAISEIIDLWY